MSFLFLLLSCLLALAVPTTSLSASSSSSLTPTELARWQAGRVTWEESGFSRFWGGLPALSELPVVDAYKVAHRHACYKHMITSESTGGSALFGRDSQHHWLWAYAAQLDWQDGSGRLNPASASAPGAIDPDSWWQIMNFMFSICVLRGASDAGLVAAPVAFTEDTEAFLRRPAVDVCSACWRDFFQYDHAEFVAAARQVPREAEFEGELDVLREDLQRAVWRAHKRAMESGLMVSSEALSALPPDEASFGRGWVNTVDLLASVCWQTSLATLLRDGLGYLPWKRLTPGALAALDADAPKEATSVRAAMALSALRPEGRRLAFACGFWRRVAHWQKARRRMPETLYNLTYGKRLLPLALARLLALAAAPRSRGEAAGWLLITGAAAAAAARHHFRCFAWF